MKKIKLTQGKYAIVDDEDFHYLSRFKWTYGVRTGQNGLSDIEGAVRVLVTRLKRNIISIEDMIVKRPIGGHYEIIFLNGNRLDFRKENMVAIPDRSNSHQGRKIVMYKGRPPQSKYKGVYQNVNSRNGLRSKKFPWRAAIQKGKNKPDTGKRIQLTKSFETEKEAASWYNERAREFFGKYAYQNKI